VLGTAEVDNMYHAGWAWAGSTPFKGTKLVAAYLGSPVSRDYAERRPFKFDGKIKKVTVALK